MSFSSEEIPLSSDQIDLHQHCTLVDCYPLGQIRSCTAKYLTDLVTLISGSQFCILSLSIHILSTLKNIKAPAAQIFGKLPNHCDPDFYLKFQLRIQQLGGIVDRLRGLSNIEENLTFCLHQHDTSSSDVMIVTILCNLYHLRNYIQEMKLHTENTLFQILDAHPRKTANNLRMVMMLVCIF